MVALFGISLLFCGGVKAYGQELSAQQKEVWKMEEASWEFFKQGDLKGYSALWHKNAQVWGYGGDAPITKGNLFEINKSFPFPRKPISGRETISLKLGWPTINIFNNIALVYYRLTIEGVDVFPFSSRVSHVWMKEEEKWQLIGGMHTKE